MQKNIICFFVLIFFIGCGPHGLIGTLPNIDNPDEAAEIYIIRTSSINAKVMGFKVSLDGLPLLGIKDGEYTKFRVKPREHTIQAVTKKGIADRESSINVICEPKGKYYVLLSPGLHKVNVKQISEEEAESRISESKYLNIE